MGNKVICLAGDKCEYSDICNHGGRTNTMRVAM